MNDEPTVADVVLYREAEENRSVAGIATIHDANFAWLEPGDEFVAGDRDRRDVRLNAAVRAFQRVMLVEDVLRVVAVRDDYPISPPSVERRGSAASRVHPSTVPLVRCIPLSAASPYHHEATRRRRKTVLAAAKPRTITP